eukprot:m.383069 g.383069  ORF g.383069 m.383069 type:complete len:87 (+) comp16728_c0_seq3:722-982(+)
MSAFIKVLQIKNKLAALHARDHQASEMIERGQRLKAEVAIKMQPRRSWRVMVEEGRLRHRILHPPPVLIVSQVYWLLANSLGVTYR